MTRPLDIEALLARRLCFERSYTPRDVILYNLSLGMGIDEADLPFVTGSTPLAIPTFAVDLAFGQRLLRPDDDFDFAREVHGEQRTLFHHPLPPATTILGEVRITDIVDKGPGKGALVIQQVILTHKDSGKRLATATGTAFFRGDGGRGGTGTQSPTPHRLPERPADNTIETRTRPDQALLYQLNGDANPLHWDPAAAQAAGFDQPILHGLCSYGIAARAVIATFCSGAPAALARFDTRFSAPLHPGETLLTDLWRDGTAVSWRCRSKERGVAVLTSGYCELT